MAVLEVLTVGLLRMSAADVIAIVAVFSILGACIVVDLWVRSRDTEQDRAARRRLVRELARREEEQDRCG